MGGLVDSSAKNSLCLVIPSLQAGGMERVMAELADYFVLKNEYDIHLILYGITREQFFSVPEEVQVHKPGFRFNNRYRFIHAIRTLFFLRFRVNKIQPKSILSFGEYWNNFVLLALLGLKYPIYVSDRSQPDKSLGQMHDKLRQWLYPKATGIILQTQKAKEIFLSGHRHNNIAVIGNPIRQFGEHSQNSNREKLVLMVGRLIKSKNQDILLEVFARVSPVDWKLVFVGYDHLKQQNMDRLKQLAEDLSVADRVVFAGKKDNIEDYYLRSSIFAFTSSSEGFPNVIGEAMQANLPVVAFDCIAGPSEMITDGINGFLVPLFNRQEFEIKLKLLMEDSLLRERLGAEAYKSIQRFNKEVICDMFYNFVTQNSATAVAIG
jgi:GalNAc-alpha-(1->4)-GalNAc-alpha-(1->3)-diNAcBac-PP-undecaprenol alpha-1,4-N-acetyl-D-galactosaminyltransferase